LLHTDDPLTHTKFMLLVLTFSIILIAAFISIAITAYCHAAVSSFPDTESQTIPCTKDVPATADTSQNVKNDIFKESVTNNQQMLIFPNQPLGELKVERG